jgi:hypothetical protein
MWQHFPFQGPPKFTQIGVFCFKTSHLATLICSAGTRCPGAFKASTREVRFQTVSLAGNRATRWVCEKLAQNVAQPMFGQDWYITSLREKVAQKRGLILFSKNRPKKKSPQMRKSPNPVTLAWNSNYSYVDEIGWPETCHKLKPRFTERRGNPRSKTRQKTKTLISVQILNAIWSLVGPYFSTKMSRLITGRLTHWHMN